MTTTRMQGASSAGEDDLTALTATMVQRMEGLFAPFRGTWDEEALIDYGLDFAREAVGKVELAKGQLSTFVCTVVKRRLLDLHRTLRRGKKRIEAHADTRQYLSEGRAFEDVDDDLPLPEWAGAVYRQAVLTLGKRHPGRRGNGGTRGLEPAQEAALLAIKRRLKLSNRGVISFLSDREDVVRSIRLKHLPSARKIDRLCDRLARRTANHRGAGRCRMAQTASDWISEAQAAQLCGLSAATLKRWRLAGSSPFTVYRPGGRVRLRRGEVSAWMEAQATPPAVGVKE